MGVPAVAGVELYNVGQKTGTEMSEDRISDRMTKNSWPSRYRVEAMNFLTIRIPNSKITILVLVFAYIALK